MCSKRGDYLKIIKLAIVEEEFLCVLVLAQCYESILKIHTLYILFVKSVQVYTHTNIFSQI